MENLNSKLQKLIDDKEKLIDKKYDIQNDSTLEASDKKTRLAIVDFNLQDVTNAIAATELQIRSQKIQEKNLEEQKLIDIKIREAEAKHIIPKIYQREVSELKRLQLMQEQEHEEIRDRAKRLKTTVNEEALKEQRKILNTKILNELSFLATTKERKRELTRIFNLRF